MPTGSLCAERNVIGTALANHPGLKREDLLMVAVLAVPLSEEPPKYSMPSSLSMCRPVGHSGKEGADFAREVEEKLKQHQTSEGVRRSMSLSSFASVAEKRSETAATKSVENEEEWEMDVFQSIEKNSKAVVTTPTSNNDDNVVLPDLNMSRNVQTDLVMPGDVSGNSTPKRRITLYNDKRSHTKLGRGGKKQKQFLLLQSVEDVNPLKPCGACNEWLKKIAESNPYFKVLTFTETNCNGVYVSPCQD